MVSFKAAAVKCRHISSMSDRHNHNLVLARSDCVTECYVHNHESVPDDSKFILCPLFLLLWQKFNQLLNVTKQKFLINSNFVTYVKLESTRSLYTGGICICNHNNKFVIS